MHLLPDGSVMRCVHGESLVHVVEYWLPERDGDVQYRTVCNFVGWFKKGEGRWLSPEREQIPTCLWCIVGTTNDGYMYRELP